jgi:heptosyltransferase-2
MSRLAVRLPNWLGDAVLALRAVDSLAAHAGADRLVLIARPWARTLFAARWPGAAWLPAPGPGGRWPGHVPALAAARADTIVLLAPSLSARLHAWTARVPRRLGLAGESGAFLLTHHAPRAARGGRHLEDEYLDLARLAGADAVPRRPLEPDEAARVAVRTRLEATGLARPSDVLVLAPGARYGPAKRWPAERFAEVARHWAFGAPGRAVVLAGGAEDVAETRAVRAASARDLPLHDWTGSTSLPELLALVAACGATLANDSGVAHLAAATGQPTVAIFGSTDPRWTAPRGPRARVVTRPPACSPCFLRTCAIPDRYLCLRTIDDTMVLRALDDAQHAESAA